MKTLRVYLSSPYEANRADQAWKDRVRSKLMGVIGPGTMTRPGVKIVDPCPGNCLEHNLAEEMKQNGDWLAFYAFCANLVEGDLAMLNGSQGMFAYLPKDAKTYGTTHEIIHSLDHQIPVVLVVPEGIQYVSRWLWGILGPNRIFDNVEEAAEVLGKRILVANGDEINDKVYYPSWQKASR